MYPYPTLDDAFVAIDKPQFFHMVEFIFGSHLGLVLVLRLDQFGWGEYRIGIHCRQVHLAGNDKGVRIVVAG